MNARFLTGGFTRGIRLYIIPRRRFYSSQSRAYERHCKTFAENRRKNAAETNCPSKKFRLKRGRTPASKSRPAHGPRTAAKFFKPQYTCAAADSPKSIFPQKNSASACMASMPAMAKTKKPRKMRGSFQKNQGYSESAPASEPMALCSTLEALHAFMKDTASSSSCFSFASSRSGALNAEA